MDNDFLDKETSKSDSEYCRFAWINAGETDSSGRKVEKIIYKEPGQYVIYFVEEDYLNAYFIDDYSFYSNLSSDFQSILFDIQDYNIKNSPSNQFVRQRIALAYFNSLNGYDELAIRVLKALIHKIHYSIFVKWILSYLIGTFTMIGLSIAVTLYSIPLSHVIYCMTSSCIGSLLFYSQMDRLSKTVQYMPIIDALVHLLTSQITGFLIFCILKSNLLFGAFSANAYGMILLCFVSGYSQDIPLKLLNKLSLMITTKVQK